MLMTKTSILTHLPLDKMAAILAADDILKCIYLNENDRIPIYISLKVVPMSPINNKPEHRRIYAALGGMSFNMASMLAIQGRYHQAIAAHVTSSATLAYILPYIRHFIC